MRSLISGGTGFLGKNLAKRLDRPVILGRNKERIQKLLGDVEAFSWDTTKHPPEESLKGVETVFHLAGESVYQGRWSPEKKQRIRDSRIIGTKNLVEQMGRMDSPPATLVCASAIGYYGSRGDERLSESSLPGNDFLSEVCVAWEQEAQKAENFGVRVVSVRIGVVLGSGGGALDKMLLPFQLGLGGTLGSGKQYMAWIHIDDLTNILLYAAEKDDLKGPVNGVSPQPVTNKDFTKTLAGLLKRPAFLPVPGVALKIALGEFASVILASQKIFPDTLIKSGYTFIHPNLNDALTSLLQP